MCAPAPAAPGGRPPRRRRCRRWAAGLVLLAAATAGGADDLASLSLEELMQLEVRLVSRRPESLANSAAAVYVLTGDELRRSGATTLPEALALVPGVHVAQLDASKWALSARGFNDVFANKLLVLIDGRSVYNPLFSGVFWESQDLGLDEVARVEIVRGPGGSMWGANAVNGVINVITTSAADDTDAVHLSLGAGVERGAAGARLHSEAPGGGRLRWTLNTFQRRALESPDGDTGADDWFVHRAGVRGDWNLDSGGSVMAAAQVYDGEAGQTFRYITALSPGSVRDVPSHSPIHGGFALVRWRQPAGAGDRWSVQAYYDQLDRRDAPVGGVIHTLDLDLQRETSRVRHEIVWGGGYRVWRDEFDGSVAFSLEPVRRTLHLASLFAQDDVRLAEAWTVSVGARLERNDYSGIELQPNLRTLWRPRAGHAVWAALSRAVRTPSRIDTDERFVGDIADADQLFPGAPPAVFLLTGNDDFEAETVLALDGGWRATLSPRLTVDVAAYRDRYEDLRTSEPGLPRPDPELEGFLLVPLQAGNRERATSWGVETSLRTDLTPHLRLRSGLSYSRLHATLEAGSREADADDLDGANPRRLGYVHLSWDPAPSLAADLVLRVVDELPARQVDAYGDVDARLAWRPRRGWRLSLALRNLLARDRLEWGTSSNILLATAVAPAGRLTVSRDL